MKVLYISYDGALEPLGRSQILSYLRALAGMGREFVLLTFDKKPGDHGGSLRSAASELKAANIEWVSLRYHKRPPVFSTFYDVICGLVVSARILKRRDISIVHARGYVPALIALFLKKAFRIKFIFDMRGFWPDLKAECGHWKNGGALHRIAKKFEGQFIKCADSIVVLAENARRILAQQGLGTCPIEVIPCCVDTGVFRMDARVSEEWRRSRGLSRKFIFAHIGSLEDWYMRAQMLDLFVTSAKIIPRAHFLVISSSPHEQMLRLAAERNIHRRDITLIKLDFAQMPAAISAVDAGMIFLSLGFSRAGCCPTKFAEFLSCGVPVVTASGIGDIDRIVSDNRVGVVLDDFSPRSYRRAVLDLQGLLEDAGLGRRCVETAAKELSLETGVSRYAALYSGLKP